MKIAVCDDNPIFIDQFTKHITELNIKTIEHDIYYSGEDLLKSYEKNCYDVVFLDMEMNGLNGLQTANKIREKNKHIIIVFITSYTKYMQDSFVCSPFRFLLKPVSFDDVKKVMHEVSLRLSEEKTTFVFTEKRNKIRLFSDDIIYFESKSHCLLIYTKERMYKISKTMTSLCKEIDKNVFSRVHNSFTVNLKHVKEVRNSEVVLHNRVEQIPIGRIYKQSFIEDFIGFKERKCVI